MSEPDDPDGASAPWPIGLLVSCVMGSFTPCEVLPQLRPGHRRAPIGDL